MSLVQLPHCKPQERPDRKHGDSQLICSQRPKCVMYGFAERCSIARRRRDLATNCEANRGCTARRAARLSPYDEWTDRTDVGGARAYYAECGQFARRTSRIL